MALVSCQECKKDISDLANACPHCGAPARASAVSSAPVVAAAPKAPNAKVGASPMRLAISGLVLLGITSFGGYKIMMSQGQRDFVNRVASNVGVPVTPWIDRAQASFRTQLSNPQQQQVIANSIMNVTHPSGAKPALGKFEVSSMGDTLVATFTVDWKGGILGTPYQTVVRWKCTQTQNLGIDLVSDNGPAGVASENFKQLSDWFQTEIYPVLLSNAN